MGKKFGNTGNRVEGIGSSKKKGRNWKGKEGGRGRGRERQEEGRSYPQEGAAGNFKAII